MKDQVKQAEQDNKMFKNRNLDIINEEYFDKDVVAVATSAGDVVGLENFKA